MGGISYLGTFANTREYIDVQLTGPLTIGQTYDVSFYVSNGYNNGTGGIGTNNMGLHFSVGALTQVANAPIALVPSWNNPTVFYDSTWQQMSFQYTPTSAVDHITVGNFYTDGATTIVNFEPSSPSRCYLVYDDFCIVPAPTPISVSNDTAICQGEYLTLYATGVGPFTWSDSATGFVFTTGDSLYGLVPNTTTVMVSDTTDTAYINVTVLPNSSASVNAVICSGNGPAIAYIDTIPNFQGCDSVITTTLSFSPTYSTPETAAICNGDSIVLGGAFQTVAGAYIDTLASVDGCDSVITTTLTINPTAVIDSVISANVSGCGVTDGTITIYVTGGSAPISYSIDGGSTFPNMTGAFTGLAAGVYNIVVDDTQGCLSIGGSVTITEPSSVSIDLVVTTDITGCNGDTSGTITITASGGTAPLSYSIDGGASFQSSGAYTGLPAGTYAIEVQDASGTPCTAIGNVDTITEPAVIVATEAITICDNDSVMLGGSYQNTAGTYIDTLTSSGGCDSIVTTTLSINTSYAVSAAATICDNDSILLGGSFQNTSGVYIDSLTAVNGCDSVLSTTLTVNVTAATALAVSICNGDSAALGGAWQTIAGSYVDSFTLATGCDSILTTTLTVNATSSDSVNRIICPGDSSFAQGAWQTIAGTYIDILPNSNGCDSVVTITLDVTNPINTTASIQICSGDSSFLQGAWQTITGSYVDSFIASGGCDSLMTTTLTVLSLGTSSTAAFICSGDSILLQGAYQTTAGSYFDTLTATNGCDSIITTTLTVNSISSSSVSVVICSGDSVFLEGAYQYSAGTYFDTLTGGNNCDSIITTILTFASSDSSLTAASICFGDSMLLQGAYQTTAGSYVDSFSNAGGCDSVVTTNLTVSSQLSVQLSSDTTIVTGGSVVLVASGGASYLWSTGDTGSSVTVSPTSTTTYWVNVSDSLGCLGTGQVTVTVLPAEYLVYVPNVLSLSSVNLEHTRLYVYGRGVESLELIIYDRWGKKVYESSDASEC